MNRANAAIVLMRHGVDPDADTGTLTALLVARGWEVTVDEVLTSAGPRGRRYRALVRQPPPPEKHPALWFPAHLQHTGPTAAEALAILLATVLARDEGSGERP